MSKFTHIAYVVAYNRPNGPENGVPLRIEKAGDSGFYASNLERFGCGKTKPTEWDAAEELVGDHGLVLCSLSLLYSSTLEGTSTARHTGAESNMEEVDRDLAHEADMRRLRKEQLAADISPEDAEEELREAGYSDDDDALMGDPDEHDLEDQSPYDDDPVGEPVLDFSGVPVPEGKAAYSLVIKAHSGYESTTTGVCDPAQYGLAVKALNQPAQGLTREHFENAVFNYRFLKSIKRTGLGGPCELMSQDCPTMAEFVRRHPEAPDQYEDPFVAGAWWAWQHLNEGEVD